MRIERMPGNSDCPKCHGDGFLRGETDGVHPPSYDMCSCVLLRELRVNLNRGMAGLASAPTVESSPLLDKERDNLVVTASEDWFRAHLRHVALRSPLTWFFYVCTDADLITSWLATASLQGNQILDPDANAVSLTHATIADLVYPPDLLVIRMGIKAARNAACAEVLAEAINLRQHARKPTWIWDQPLNRLVPGHLFHSEIIDGILRTWPRITENANTRPKASPNKTEASTPTVGEGGRFVLSDMRPQRKGKVKE
jgi:hypothetical protein